MANGHSMRALFKERERPRHAEQIYVNQKSVRLNVKLRDGPKRLPPREQAERVLCRAETLFWNTIWCFFLIPPS